MQLYLLDHQRVHEVLVQSLGYLFGIVEEDLLNLDLRLGRTRGTRNHVIRALRHRPVNPSVPQPLLLFLLELATRFVPSPYLGSEPGLAKHLGSVVVVRTRAACMSFAFAAAASPHLCVVGRCTHSLRRGLGTVKNRNCKKNHA